MEMLTTRFPAIPRWLLQHVNWENMRNAVNICKHQLARNQPCHHYLHAARQSSVQLQQITGGNHSLRMPSRKLSHDRFNPESVELAPASGFHLPEPEFDWDYLCNPTNTAQIKHNIQNRKGVGNIDKVIELWKQVCDPDEVEVDSFYQERDKDLLVLKKQLRNEALKIPNRTHPAAPIGDDGAYRLLETVGTKRKFDFEPKSAVELGEQLGLLRTRNVGHTTGQRSYYLIGDLARLEQVLIRYTVDRLLERMFLFYSVPDMIRGGIIEGCGFQVDGERTQVYKLDPSKHGDVCLAGTGEMSLAGYYMNKMIELEKLPRRAACVSRCYRAETSDLEEEKGIYRVHQFNKVEMFGLTASDTGTESEDLMLEFVEFQKLIFRDLGLHFRVLDMATQELGAPAYRKFDMEAWMPAKQHWGEISSTSNCLDFQSRRLNMKYWTTEGKLRHMHTINGTACAIPRMIIAILENYQRKVLINFVLGIISWILIKSLHIKDGSIEIPRVLQTYFKGQTLIQKIDKPLMMHFTKLTKNMKKEIKQVKTFNT